MEPGAFDSDLGILLATEAPREFEEKLELCRRAVECYKGELLPGIEDDWVTDARVRLSHLFFRALLFLSDAEMEQNPTLALGFAIRAVEEEPLQDGARTRKIQALVKLGETAAAQLEYERFADLLDQELGMRPADTVLEALVGTVHVAKPALRQDRHGVPDDIGFAFEAYGSGDRPQQGVELAIALCPHWISNGTPNLGLRLLRKAIRQASGRLKSEQAASALLSEAELEAARGDLNASLALLGKLRIKECTLPDSVRAKALLLETRLALAHIENRKAKENGQQALEVASRIGDDTLRVDVLNALAIASTYQGDFPAALECATKALEIATGNNETISAARALLQRAHALEGLGRNKSAMAAAQRVLRLVGGRHDSIVSGVRLEVSRLFEDLGDLAGAEAGYRAAISDFREFENAFRLVVSLTYLGDLLQSGGRSTEAVVVLREAIDIRRRLDQRLGIATSLRGLGRALLDLSRWEEAKEALTESARLFLDVNEMPGYASALFALALVERSLGATDLSRRLAQRARQILLGLSEAERKSIGPTGPGLIRESEQLIASLDAQIS